jgi:hypothetical protein
MEPSTDRPIPDAEIDEFYTVARKAGIYHAALIKQGIPADLASQLVRDWHLAQMGPPITRYGGVAEELIREIVTAARRARAIP